MKTSQCHPEEEAKCQTCEHLLARIGKSCNSENLSHYRRFTGNGSEYMLLCSECANTKSRIDSHLRWACKDCFDDVAVGGKRLGEQGSPELRERFAGLSLKHERISFTTPVTRLLSIEAVLKSDTQRWIALNDQRELLVLDTETRTARRLLHLDGLEVPHDHPLSLIVSPAGEFVAIASMYGSHGVVVDTRSCKVTMRLNRGAYHVEHCRFSVAFFEHRSRTLLVHATDWNRLDVSDPSTGELLTAREPTKYQADQKRPEHYLDYFQCGLFVSPDGEWIASNGWVWHPVGAIDTWSLKQWMESYRWESEDGESRRRLCWRNYYWDGPVCWVSNRTLAAWGHGDDDVLLVPGVRFFDVVTGTELPGFAGPTTCGSTIHEITSNGEASKVSRALGSLLFDEFLFCYGRGCEFTAWDIETGERVLRDEKFLPLGYHRMAKAFLSQNEDGSFWITNLGKHE